MSHYFAVVASQNLDETLQHVALPEFESLHTLGSDLYAGNPDKTAIFINWVTKSIQNLPLVHPLDQIVFHVWSLPSSLPEVVQGWSNLDEAVSASSRQVTTVFNLDRRMSAEAIATQRQFITSSFPLSKKCGLLSFGWCHGR